MTIQKGNHNIGPENGTLTVKVYKDGMAAKMGHDLVFEATKWRGNVTVDPENISGSSAQVTIDARSLEIIDALGGAKPLGDKDRQDIAKNIEEKCLQVSTHPDITFDSTDVSGDASRISLNGDLTLVGNSRPVTLDLSVGDDGHVTGKVTLVQSQFGIKPFSAMMGALKVKDSVDIEFKVALPVA